LSSLGQMSGQILKVQYSMQDEMKDTNTQIIQSLYHRGWDINVNANTYVISTCHTYGRKFAKTKKNPEGEQPLSHNKQS
jgi:hypothetical protein